MLGRSQPSITRAIQDLEGNLGFGLFYRNGPRIAPTSKAVQFYAEAERFLVGLRHIRERAEAIAGEEPSPFEIAAISAFASTIVAEALARVDKQLLPRKVLLNAMSAENVVQSVASGRAELGVASFPLDHPGVELLWAAEAGCVALMRADSPLARRERIPLSELVDRPIIATSNPFRLRPRLEAAFREEGLTMISAIDTTASLPAIAAARAGLGIAVIDPVSGYGAPQDGVVVRPLETYVPFRFGIISRVAAPVMPALVDFSARLQDVARQMLPDFRELST